MIPGINDLTNIMTNLDDFDINELPQNWQNEILAAGEELKGVLLSELEEVVYKTADNAAIDPYSTYMEVVKEGKKLRASFLEQEQTKPFHTTNIQKQLGTIFRKWLDKLPLKNRQAIQFIINYEGGLKASMLKMFGKADKVCFAFDEEDELQATYWLEGVEHPLEPAKLFI